MVYLLPFITIVYPVLIIFFGILWVIKKGNKNEEVLYVAAYIVGVEVFLRMAGGIILYEFAKYGRLKTYWGSPKTAQQSAETPL